MNCRRGYAERIAIGSRIGMEAQIVMKDGIGTEQAVIFLRHLDACSKNSAWSTSKTIQLSVLQRIWPIPLSALL